MSTVVIKSNLPCDICGHCVSGFDDFNEAVDYKKENGWKSIDGKDMCPECLKGGK